ncbi:rab11 family-interacting protein 1 isoform X3 [Eucyclogobius newberryi]|uniref:rab11 family-interacting protein 1 isoform X3 n=1 Tax=Eucyclogobius newberryi TaxID=166745 RepID=UPI003B5B3CA3
MSLVDQSQQWYPTSVRVTVHQAKDLRAKGKNGTNDAYAIIQVAKDKFSTTVSEKCVSPVWKEEAAFDLPLFHPGNADRCTLHVIVMHRAQVGLDKFLGQAVVNLLALHDNKARQRTDWFKLVDKAGKEDKARGQVLLDIQFLRNNISASMLDLSMQDKPRSRISKIKDKVRGKKKDSFSDSASAIVPSVSRVLTDSEGEGDSVSLSQSPGVKKKSKFKTLFAPKSNLQRNVSQSMSTLGTLPEKNSSLSSSRSSGLNIDSPDVKKKFKFLGHKRTGSSDSKVSQGPFSLLNRSKQNDLNSLCINGSHVYAEEAEAKSGSTMSLNSSGHGSVEDIHKQPFDVPVDVPAFSVNVPASSSSQSAERALLEQQRHQEEQRKIAEARRLEEEERRRADAFRLQQEEERRHQKEQERKRQLQEDEAKRRKHREEEDMRRRQEEVQRQEAAEEEQRQRQEQLKAEEQKKQEEASMSERLTSLFGMIRKKEEKKEEVVPEEPPTPIIIQDLPVPKQSTKPFEEVSLSSSPPQSPNESKPNSSAPIPSAMVFLNRTAKVKPRPHAVKPLNPADSHPPSSTPAFKEIKGQDSAPSKYKVSGSSESGPYTQLTQEELITMVVKQQVDLSKKDSKIVELEEYIDNLLVRVIEEKPSILNSLDAKPH